MAAVIRIERSAGGWEYVLAGQDGAVAFKVSIPEGQLRALVGDALALLDSNDDYVTQPPSIGEMLARNVKPVSIDEVMQRR